MERTSTSLKHTRDWALKVPARPDWLMRYKPYLTIPYTQTFKHTYTPPKAKQANQVSTTSVTSFPDISLFSSSAHLYIKCFAELFSHNQPHTKWTHTLHYLHIFSTLFAMSRGSFTCTATYDDVHMCVWTIYNCSVCIVKVRESLRHHRAAYTQWKLYLSRCPSNVNVALPKTHDVVTILSHIHKLANTYYAFCPEYFATKTSTTYARR